ncbi:MAG: putative minor capsid protein [Aerococcus suis]|nr:putative minor capsid protein [Aerococcus suis]
MTIPNLPKTWLIHSIDYLEKGERDRYGKTTNKVTTIKNVRVEPTKTFENANAQEQAKSSFVIFVDGKHSTPLVDFKEGEKIRFNGHDYVIVVVSPFDFPESNELHHYEIEVV